MKNIKFKESFNNCRASIYKPETRQFLLSRIAGSEQEKDMSVPSNCDGYGRIHHLDVMLINGYKIRCQMIQHVKHWKFLILICLRHRYFSLHHVMFIVGIVLYRMS